MKYIGVTPKMTENAIAQIESSSLHHISAKWKKTASLVDLNKLRIISDMNRRVAL